MIALGIPYPFVVSRVSLSWREVLVGLEHRWLHPSVPPLLAADSVAANPDPHPLLIALAGLRADEANRELVAALAALEPDRESDSLQRTWAFLVLAWIYEHREYGDPWPALDLAYAELGYPEEVGGFVGFMPREGPDLGPRLNEERRFKDWKAYLDACQERFVGRASVPLSLA